MLHSHPTSHNASHTENANKIQTTVRHIQRVGGLVLLTCLMLAVPAIGQLARSGPVDPSNGFPAWYQDKTGLALDQCLPQNNAETTWCLLPPIPNGPPETFPNNWAIENFYADAAAGDRKVPIPGTTQTSVILLTIDLESSFANGFNVVPGDQVVFARTRIKIAPVPFDGDYTVYTPVGKFVFPGQTANQPRGIFFTEDIGLGSVGNFAAALDGRIGPFLLPSTAPGGPEVPPIPLLQAGQDPFFDALAAGGGATPYPGNGRKYIADPARIGPITGGKGDSVMPDGTPAWTLPNGTLISANSFHVEGPNGFVYDTTNFTLMGRIFEGPIAGETSIDRASYAASGTAASPSYKVDVYATASPSTQGRVPAGQPPATLPATLAWYDAPCTATLDANGNPGPPYSAPIPAPALNQMFANGSTFFGESTPATLPPQVCVQGNAVNSTGQTVTTYTPRELADQVFITQAQFDPGSQSLAVTASSSDQVTPQTLTVTYGAGLSKTTASGTQLIVNPLLAVPSKISVLSSASGVNEMQVSTATVNGGGGTSVPVANNDTASVNENCSATATSTPCGTPINITVLANDTGATGGTVAIASPPVLGTATVVTNADGSQAINYTPNLNAFGTDTFTYNVTVGTQVSNSASVTVVINHINQAPTANNDSVGALRGLQNSTNVLANDTDPDGAADLASVVIDATGSPALGIAPNATFNGPVTFTPPASTVTGTYTFSYYAVDTAGLRSAAPATVTVTLSASEAIVPAKAIYTQNKGRWVLSGTASPIAGQTITMTYVDGTYKVNGACSGSAAGTVVGSATVDATGNFLFDQILSNTSGVLNPSNTLGNSQGFWCTPPKTMHFSSSLSSATANLAIQFK